MILFGSRMITVGVRIITNVHKPHIIFKFCTFASHPTNTACVESIKKYLNDIKENRSKIFDYLMQSKVSLQEEKIRANKKKGQLIDIAIVCKDTIESRVMRDIEEKERR